MSPTPDSSRKPRAFPWACVPLSLLAMVVLYVATWPIVELKLTDYKVVSLSKGITIHRAPPPTWVTAMYRPLHHLCDPGRLGKRKSSLLLNYWNWWQVQLWSPTFTPSGAAPKPMP
jgi:hypothetical protein